MSVSVCVGFIVAMSFQFFTGNVARADTSNSGSIAVGGNDNVGGYEGSGGLLLPGSFAGNSTSRSSVARCLGCVWRYTVYCEHGNDSLCAHAVVTCPHGQIRYRVWFGSTREELAVIGSVCWGDSQPVTRRDFEQRVHDVALRLVPPLLPGMNPAKSTLVSVPVITWSGQPRTFHPRPMMLVGHRVAISAQAMWQWQWGDGEVNWTTNSGQRYPSSAISHRYRHSGLYQIRVATIWDATYSIGGIGSFQVGGNVVHQQKALRIRVLPSRAILEAH
jgi:hypothetical protein